MDSQGQHSPAPPPGDPPTPVLHYQPRKVEHFGPNALEVIVGSVGILFALGLSTLACVTLWAACMLAISQPLLLAVLVFFGYAIVLASALSLARTSVSTIRGHGHMPEGFFDADGSREMCNAVFAAGVGLGLFILLICHSTRILSETAFSFESATSLLFAIIALIVSLTCVGFAAREFRGPRPGGQ